MQSCCIKLEHFISQYIHVKGKLIQSSRGMCVNTSYKLSLVQGCMGAHKAALRPIHLLAIFQGICNGAVPAGCHHAHMLLLILPDVAEHLIQVAALAQTSRHQSCTALIS